MLGTLTKSVDEMKARAMLARMMTASAHRPRMTQLSSAAFGFYFYFYYVNKHRGQRLKPA
jgi:hypothetical protein